MTAVVFEDFPSILSFMCTEIRQESSDHCVTPDSFRYFSLNRANKGKKKKRKKDLSLITEPPHAPRWCTAPRRVSPDPPCGCGGSGRSCEAVGWVVAPPPGCSPLSCRVSRAWLEAEACGKGCDEDHESEHGGEAGPHGSGCLAQDGREHGGVRVGVGGCADVGVRLDCGSGTGGPDPRSRPLVRRSGCVDKEKPGTHQGWTTCGWEVAPRRHSWWAQVPDTGLQSYSRWGRKPRCWHCPTEWSCCLPALTED